LNQTARSSSTLLAALFLLLIFVYTVHPLSDSDQLYHLKVGQVIWESKSVPTQDIFTYTAPGVRWVTHEWLAELIFYAFYAAAGYWGVMFFVSALAAATLSILYRLAVERGADKDISALLLFIFGYLAIDWWLARPQVLAYFSFALLFYLLERYREKREYRYLFAAVATMWFWANVNASFILGLVVFGLYWIMVRRKVGPALVAAIAISFVNPNGYHIFLYSFYIQQVVKILNIFEWRPILAYFDNPSIKILLAEMAIADLFVLYWFGVRERSRDLLLLGVTMGVSLMPFISVRHYAFWPLAVMVPLLIGVSSALQGSLARIGTATVRLLLFGIGFGFLALRVSSFPRVPVQQNTLPVFGVDFVDRIGLKGPRFNLYNEGGYLIWHDWPSQKVFIDGRSEIFEGQPIKEFLDILADQPDWNGLVNDKYHINYFLIAYRPESVAKNMMPLVGKLISERWALVYWDDQNLVYVRNAPQNESIIRQYALYYVSPFRDPMTITAPELPAVKENLARALQAAPQSQVLHAYAAQVSANLEKK
jgi:hypothetical protein